MRKDLICRREKEERQKKNHSSSSIKTWKKERQLFEWKHLISDEGRPLVFNLALLGCV